jgi:DMSO/TMAO reductase YedYZ heme-binding membrane subunit
MTSLLGTTANWYLMRASGFVALALFTLTICLGIANVGRLAKGAWTRAVAALVHRNASLLAVVFLFIHVITATSDRYVNVPALSSIVPGLSGYDPLWIGIGALSVDLVIAVAATSLLRKRMRPATWRLVHWLSYICWPAAFVHSIGAGSGQGVDTGHTWSTAIYFICGAAFAIAVAARLALRERQLHQPGKALAVDHRTPRYAAVIPATRPRTMP